MKFLLDINSKVIVIQLKRKKEKENSKVTLVVCTKRVSWEKANQGNEKRLEYLYLNYNISTSFALSVLAPVAGIEF